MNENKILLLKTIVGSQAHGLADKDSDFDYRGVFTYPTNELLSLHPPKAQTHWIEAKVDDTMWELSKFLLMATKCNPTVLETFLAPITEIDPHKDSFITGLGGELQALFPHVWNSTDVKNAFIGYSLSQRKKFLADKDGRSDKYAVAYLRVLFQAHELLTTDTFSVNMESTPIFELLKKFRSGDYRIGEVIDVCFKWETMVLKAYKANPDKETNIEPVNEYILKVRKDLWKN